MDAMRANRRINKQSARWRGEKKRGLFKHFMVAVLFVIAIAGLYLGLRFALHVSRFTIFPLKEVVFSGNKHLTDGELKAMIGLKGDESLLWLSGRELASKLSKSPWVRAVSLRKDFPWRLSVKVEEASPFALLEMRGHMFLVDYMGNLLEELKGDSIPFLPIISGDPFKDQSNFLEALNLVRVTKGKGFAAEKDHIEIIAAGTGSEGLTIRVDDIVVKIGYGEYEEKLGRLLELEDEIRKRGIPVDYIDLRFANKVVVKPINEVIR